MGGLLSSAVPDLDGWRAQPLEPGSCWHAERGVTHRQEEGCCSGQGAQGTGDPEQVQPVQRLLAAHRRCSLTTGGNGYVDGGDVDISNFERDNYPAAPLTDGTDGYSEPKTVDSAPLTDDSYSETKTVDTAPLTDDSYSETKTVDAAPLTDGSYSEPKTAPQTEGSYDDA